MPSNSFQLRSTQWFDTPELYGWLRKAAFMAQGYGPEAYDSRPIIGICNSWSELTHCNSHLRQIAEAVKRGVWQAGGFPMEFPRHVARRVQHAPHHDALQKSDEHGGRRVDPCQPPRRCRAARRMRQDHPCPAHGRRKRRRSSHSRYRRTPAQGQLARRRARLLHRLPTL